MSNTRSVKRETVGRSRPGVRARTRTALALLLLLAFAAAAGTTLSKQSVQQNTGTKVQPANTATINVQEVERREKERVQPEGQKAPENENLVVPPSLPVPGGARGETFRAELPPQSAGVELKRKESPTQLEPLFPAIGDNGTTIPPDVGGAAGPNHVMTTLNSQVRIQDKAGAVISTVSLNGFFSPLVGAASVFDPKVLYDPFAGRWILTAPANSNSASSALLIAVSATNDPTGTWTAYSFDVDSANANWFDYPSIGFNRNWIVVTGNLFQIVTPGSPDPFAGAQIYMFDKAALYAGATAPTVLNRPTTDGFTICPAVTLDNSQNTEYMVSNWNSNSGGNGYLRIYTITGTAAAPSYAMTALLPNVAQPWAFGPTSGADFAPQSGSAQKIQNGDTRMQNVVFRNGSVWCAHSAFLPAATPTRTAAQWWQIDPTTATVQQFGRVDDSTGANFFAYPSIAVNVYNDVLLGYSSFSASQFASSNYSFRLHTDAPNTMQPTVQFKAGLGTYFKTYSGTKNRWGDYTSTCIDPDDFSLWTLQEYAETPANTWGTEWNRWVPPLPNLYVKDLVGDTGAEPDPSTLPMWQGYDIWLRKTQDTPHAFAHVTENAEYRTGTSNPNYVYVDVRNRGAAPSAGTEQLTLYWAKASSGLSWPSPWTGGVYFDPGPNTMLMGNVIATQTIPVTAAGAETILEFPWNPPDPAVYTGPLAADQNHFCLLARVTTSTTAPFGMTFPEVTGDLYGNVQRNNHIAWLNIHVYDLLPGTSAPAHALIANLGDQVMNVKLKFTAMDAEGNPALLDRGVLKVTPGDKLRAAFKERAPAGENVRDAGDGTYQILKDGATIQNIQLAPKDWATLDIAYVPNDRSEKSAGYAITLTQIDQTGGTERLLGGQTFVFGTVKGLGTSGGGGGGGSYWPWWWWILLLILLIILIILLLRWLRNR